MNGLPACAARLARSGCVHLRSHRTGVVSGSDWASFTYQWNSLTADMDFRSTGCQRERRYARLTAGLPNADHMEATRLPHEPFLQVASDNRLYSGLVRHFAPCAASLLDNPVLRHLLAFDLSVVADVGTAWDIGLHQIRLRWDGTVPATATPEGRHNDGHWFIAMHMIAITPSAGGVSCVYDPREPRNPVLATRLAEPGDTLIVDDRRVLHEVSPVLPTRGEGHRDMLIIDFRHPVAGYQHVRTGDKSAATPSAPASPFQSPAERVRRTT